ncbi:MAG TPA: HmuY family protein [Candidatus Nanopelagicales bacterium]|nr:HmuY family protein [Candidatus Nanopelagicales bacterium]
MILQLNLQSDVTPGLVENEAEGAGWVSTIDATAGGAFTSDPTSYTYGRFTEQGLVKVEISDEQSLESMDWDIAFRRYVIRINSGNSGPSCVTATPIPGDPAYDEVTAVPETLPQFRTDEYFTAGCELINDGSGLESSPATALAGYYTYPGCVAMSDRTFIVETAEGRRLKLTVSDYYFPDVQEQCDTMSTLPMTSTGSANFRVRWAFLP